MREARPAHAATLLDVLIDGFEKNEILDGYHWRDIPLATEDEARDRFHAFAAEGRRWKGPARRYEEDAGRRAAIWPDLEILQAGRGVRVRVRAPWFSDWWHKEETWSGDPFAALWEWQKESRAGVGESERPDPSAEVQDLLRSIRAHLPELESLLAKVDGHWFGEDGVYRFYHQSFKVYGLQDTTEEVTAALRALAPDRVMNEWFLEIVRSGTGKRWVMEHNRDWLVHTRPIVEAFFHARYFLEMAVRYGGQLETAPASMPSGWAALLYLYGLR